MINLYAALGSKTEQLTSDNCTALFGYLLDIMRVYKDADVLKTTHYMIDTTFKQMFKLQSRDLVDSLDKF